MSIQANEVDATIQRIKEKLQINYVILGTPLTIQEVTAFETKYAVLLPAGFRQFLIEIASSCKWKPGGAPFVTSPLDCPNPEKLASPFPFEAEWIWEFEDELSHSLATIENGVLELTDIGCGCSFCLIITGNCYGEVWHFSEMGIQPCCPREDFLSWLEKWLDSRGEADYFSEYPYP